MTIECDCALYLCEQTNSKERRRLNKILPDTIDRCPIIAKCDIFRQGIKGVLDSRRVNEPKETTVSIKINNVVKS